MGTTSVRDSILLVGASGRTGRYVLRYLCAASVPVIACVRGADRLASELSLQSAEVVFANVEQPHTFAPLIERAAHVIYLAGGDRRGLSPGAWQVEVDGLSDCLDSPGAPVCRVDGFRWATADRISAVPPPGRRPGGAN